MLHPHLLTRIRPSAWTAAGTVTVLLATLLAACNEGTADDTATLVVRNAHVWTGVSGDARTATAVAVSGERIVAVGSDADVEAWIGRETQVVDAEGGLVTLHRRARPLPGRRLPPLVGTAA